LGGRKGTRPVKTELWGAGVVICLERGADLHTAQLMPLPLTVSCCSKIQTGFTFLVPAHPGSPGKRAVKRVCVCVCIITFRLDEEQKKTVSFFQRSRRHGHAIARFFGPSCPSADMLAVIKETAPQTPARPAMANLSATIGSRRRSRTAQRWRGVELTLKIELL